MKTKKIYNEAGYSLVESIVALALLATVLVPLSNFVVGLTTHRMSKQKIEAFLVAQAAMEDALLKQYSEDRSALIRKGKWLITEQYEMNEDIIIIEVKVSRLNREDPQIILQTARLLTAIIQHNQLAL